MQTPQRRRAVLIAPGSDERKARKALASTADEVVLDLEDAVTAAHKPAARDLACRLVHENAGARPVSIRVNALGTPWGAADLEACAELGSALASVVLPMTESVHDLVEADRILAGTSIGVQALVETPLGIRDIGEITRATSRLQSVIIGYADLGAALGRSPSALPEHWLAVQDAVLIAARAAGIQAVDGPFLGIADDERFRRAADWTSALGFDGKWVIHPTQVDSATTAFTPSDAAIEDACRVLEALRVAEEDGAGAAQLDGQMLDEAVAVAARRVLAQVGGQ
ncbi:HpcH/HpaI aldolase/citrate lyase family protein [Tomitella biformata]|uniref:HpcH/HpaI aldolase/citrate lyase family protein n=1 Tax=Tomitella biformata TaxID=630403 RepID=UPI000466BC72|nr:CoA ester lyase [Tomitella biformata]